MALQVPGMVPASKYKMGVTLSRLLEDLCKPGEMGTAGILQQHALLQAGPDVPCSVHAAPL